MDKVKPQSCLIQKIYLPTQYEFATLVKRKNKSAGIAQLVEQRTENPRVPGSSPGPGIHIDRAVGKRQRDTARNHSQSY